MNPEESCLVLLKELETNMEKHMNNAMRELDITVTQARALVTLQSFPKKQASLKNLEKKLQLSQSVTVGIIKRLEQRNYVESFGDSEDKRIKIVRITPLGERQCKASQKILTRLENRFLSALTEEEHVVFSALLKKVKAAMD
ncbi:MarR family transcriptional regulator [Anaerovorax odorimutans]|uniref:MarR family transcriptional regulator n=1 Tax=Anaerovorax odorimutans TaxID=109327 RepID=A0ABT1RJ18_9FIRM|nr:MarR family transcriptional regulator [Anaerovorax odorimutans]MCQ4635177.1 MarR family transcriptional regulator [Anaerovorax odorimutans]